MEKSKNGREMPPLPVDLDHIYRALVLKIIYFPNNDMIFRHNDIEVSRIMNYYYVAD